MLSTLLAVNGGRPPKITVVVHRVDTTAHATVPPGYRWAIMLGDGPPSDMDNCVNAGWCPTEQEACIEGEMVGSAVSRALSWVGVPSRYGLTKLDHDPIPPDGDRLNMGA
jgi:hypothetical protein